MSGKGSKGGAASAGKKRPAPSEGEGTAAAAAAAAEGTLAIIDAVPAAKIARLANEPVENSMGRGAWS
jgi:hypothetical protein